MHTPQHNTHMHMYTYRVVHQGNGTEEEVFFKRKVFKEDWIGGLGGEGEDVWHWAHVCGGPTVNTNSWADPLHSALVTHGFEWAAELYTVCLTVRQGGALTAATAFQLPEQNG